MIRFGFLPQDQASFSAMCDCADAALFANIVASETHVLHQLLPPRAIQQYSLRPRAHNFRLPITDTLFRKTFVHKMLFYNFNVVHA